jgi:hypothetical protein
MAAIEKEDPAQCRIMARLGSSGGRTQRLLFGLQRPQTANSLIDLGEAIGHSILHGNFNDVRVRSFIPTGAPLKSNSYAIFPQVLWVGSYQLATTRGFVE